MQPLGGIEGPLPSINEIPSPYKIKCNQAVKFFSEVLYSYILVNCVHCSNRPFRSDVTSRVVNNNHIARGENILILRRFLVRTIHFRLKFLIVSRVVFSLKCLINTSMSYQGKRKQDIWKN